MFMAIASTLVGSIVGTGLAFVGTVIGFAWPMILP